MWPPKVQTPKGKSKGINLLVYTGGVLANVPGPEILTCGIRVLAVNNIKHTTRTSKHFLQLCSPPPSNSVRIYAACT